MLSPDETRSAVQAASEAQDFDAFRNAILELDPAGLSSGRVGALARTLDALPGEPAQRVALLGNVTVDFLAARLKVEAAREGLRIGTHVGGFGQHYQDVLEVGGALERFAPDIVFLALAPTELFPDRMAVVPDLSDEARRGVRDEVLDHVRSWLDVAEKRLRSSLLVCNFPRPSFVGAGVADPNQAFGETELYYDLNVSLLRLLRDRPRSHLFDLERVLASVGHVHARDPKMYYLAKLHWAEPALPAIATEFVRHLRAHAGRTRKCVVADLDNTLWGGVVGEEGPMGVKVGEGDPSAEAYRDFQRRLRALKARGILLAICSKNNEQDAREVFERRPEMPLKLDDFAAWRINWEPKHANIASIAEELNIGTDSLVFLDDNPAEISLVEQMMPEVKSVLVPRDAAGLTGVIEALLEFEKVQLLDDDVRKTELYLQNRQRTQQSVEAGDMQAYLESLGTSVGIREAVAADVVRAHQLFTKTNQFNLTTIRYGVGDVERFLASPDHKLLVVSARDRFGDLGIIGLCLVELERDALRIDSFILSCRAMGRGIETAIMNRIKRYARDAAPEGRLHGLYLPTRKNKPVESFLESQGFRRAEAQPDEGVAWTLDVRDAADLDCSWIAVEDAPGG